MKTDKRNSLIAIGAGVLLLGYAVKKSYDESQGDGVGQFGGSDDQFNDVLNPYFPEGNPFQRIDPNYHYETPIPYPESPVPSTEPSISPSYIPNAFTPIPDNNFNNTSGSVSNDLNPLQDFGVIGGAFALDAGAKVAGKATTNLIDSKFKKPELPENKLRQFLADPYGLDKRATKQTTDVIAKTATEQVLKEAPTWLKWTRKVANVVPLVDVPIGAALDVYFTKDDPNPIGWGDAIVGNVVGELAQLGITAGGAAAGFGVGAVPAWFIGTAGDIAATESYYAARGKSSLYDLAKPTTAQVATSQKVNDKPMVQASSTNDLFQALGYGSQPMSYAPVNTGSTPKLSNSSSKSSSSSSNAKKTTSSGSVVNISTAKDPVVRNYENTNLVSTTLSSSQISAMNSFNSLIGISTKNPISSSSSSKSSSSSSSKSSSSSSKSSSSSSSKLKTDSLSGKNKGKGTYTVTKADGSKVKRYYQ